MLEYSVLELIQVELKIDFISLCFEFDFFPFQKLLLVKFIFKKNKIVLFLKFQIFDRRPVF